MVNTAAEVARDVATRPFLPAEALDGIADLLARAPDAASRAAIVSILVGEIYDTAVWLVNSSGSQEVLSMSQIVAEARAHQARMTGSDARSTLSGAFFHQDASVVGVPA